MNRFGNVLLNVTASDLGEAGLDQTDVIAIDATGGSALARRVATYTDVEPGDWGLIAACGALGLFGVICWRREMGRNRISPDCRKCGQTRARTTRHAGYNISQHA